MGSSETKRSDNYIMKLTSQWIAGFVDGEGCFHVGYYKSGQIQPEFTVVQHTRSIKVLYALKSFFGCGSVRQQKPNLWYYRVRRRSDLLDTIIPFFEKNELKTHKKVDFIRFRWITIQCSRNNHLNDEGLKWILRIRNLMNRNRK